MGILGLLIHLEAMGCVYIAREGRNVCYALEEGGRTQRQIERQDRKVYDLIGQHKALLLRFLKPVAPEDIVVA